MSVKDEPQKAATQKVEPPKKKSRPVLRRLVRGVGAFFAFVLFYAAFLALGYVPTNNDYQPPSGGDSVVIFVRSNDIHTDLVLPVVELESGFDWRTVFPPEHFLDDIRPADYVAIGWGDRGFFMETPQWKDLKVSTLLKALVGLNGSVLHVEYVSDPEENLWTREVHITRAQYQTLIHHVRSSIKSDNSEAQSAGPATYGRRDHFFEARGAYNLFNTCNQWTGRGLKGAGVPTGIWTPLKDQVMRRLPPKPAL